MAAVIAGVDVASTRLDIVLLNEDTTAARHHSIPCGRNAIETAWRMREYLPGSRFWTYHNVRLVAMERPIGWRVKTVQAQMLVIGAVLSRLPSDVDVVLPFPHLWKPAVGLKGNATKEDVRQWAYEHGADATWSSDGCDALALAWGAMREPGRGRLAA